MKIGENIKKFRKAKGLTQVELAQVSGVTQNNISRYESGEVLPQIESIAKIAKALNVLFVDLLPENAGVEVEIKEGCEFCIGNKSIIETRKMGQYSDSFVGIDIYIDGGNKINIDACNEQKTGCSCYQDVLIKINYCPMCGRKL